MPLTHDQTAFLTALRDLLCEHNAYFSFTCADDSDTRGISGDHVRLMQRRGAYTHDTDTVLLASDGWRVTSYDIDEHLNYLSKEPK